MNFKGIEEVLSSDFGLLSDGYEEKKKTDRVLKSTKIEQAIFDDLSSDCAELPDYEKKGMEKLPCRCKKQIMQQRCISKWDLRLLVKMRKNILWCVS